jgi:hypothetical protein
MPIPETDQLFIVEKCSVTILNGLPDKMGDLSIPTISCQIGAQKFDQALCELGVSVSVMPKVIYDKLNHNSLVPISMYIQLADQSIRRRVGIIEDILVKNQEFLRTSGFCVTRDGCLLIERRHSHSSQKG